MAWMMTFDDGSNGPVLRADKQLMDAHWEYELTIQDKIIAAGSLRTDDGKTPIGGLLIVDTDTKEDAMNLLKNDPATKAGLRNNVKVVFWNPAILDKKVQG